ncbi:MAG: hypothetical protein R3D98_04085 [Candidatus Krumholzibacteriia bacterium]
MNRLNIPIIALAFVLLARPTPAATHTTRGAIASVAVPRGFVAQHDPASDVTLLTRDAGDQIMLLAGPAVDPRRTMVQLLQLFGAPHLIPAIEGANLSGHPGVRVQARVQVFERWYVVAVGDGSVVVRLASSTSFDHLEPEAAAVVESLRLAPATHPAQVAGAFDTGSYYSGVDRGGGGTGVAADSSVHLRADGSLVTGGQVGASGGWGTVMGQAAEAGRWEVRGDRLHLVYADGSLGNFRLAVFNNGLELFDAGGRKLVWARR